MICYLAETRLSKHSGGGWMYKGWLVYNRLNSLEAAFYERLCKSILKLLPVNNIQSGYTDVLEEHDDKTISHDYIVVANSSNLFFNWDGSKPRYERLANEVIFVDEKPSILHCLAVDRVNFRNACNLSERIDIYPYCTSVNKGTSLLSISHSELVNSLDLQKILSDGDVFKDLLMILNRELDNAYNF